MSEEKSDRVKVYFMLEGGFPSNAIDASCNRKPFCLMALRKSRTTPTMALKSCAEG